MRETDVGGPPGNKRPVPWGGGEEGGPRKLNSDPIRKELNCAVAGSEPPGGSPAGEHHLQVLKVLPEPHLLGESRTGRGRHWWCESPRPSSEQRRAGASRRECWMTSCLSPGLFQTPHACVHGLRPPQLAGPCSWERNRWGAPGLFREASKNMCFLSGHLLALSSGHQQRSRVVLSGSQRGWVRFSEKRGVGNPGFTHRLRQKEGQRRKRERRG